MYSNPKKYNRLTELQISSVLTQLFDNFLWENVDNTNGPSLRILSRTFVKNYIKFQKKWTRIVREISCRIRQELLNYFIFTDESKSSAIMCACVGSVCTILSVYYYCVSLCFFLFLCVFFFVSLCFFLYILPSVYIIFFSCFFSSVYFHVHYCPLLSCLSFFCCLPVVYLFS